MSLFQAYLFVLLFGLAWTQPITRYLNNLTVPQLLEIKICPSDVSSRSGSIAVKAPDDEAINILDFQAPVAVALAVDDSPDCLVSENHQYAFFLNFRSFQLNQLKEPVYLVEIDEPSDEGRKIKKPNMALIDYTLMQFQSVPPSEVQYLSKFALKPSVTVNIEIKRSDLTNVDWKTLAIDYVLLAQNTSMADVDQLVYCQTLKGYVAKDLYYITSSSLLTACPQDCSDISGFESVTFDKNSFSYGSCGRERTSVKRGGKEKPYGRQTVNFILNWDILAGIIAGSVVLFVLFPMVILCIGYYRRKR